MQWSNVFFHCRQPSFWISRELTVALIHRIAATVFPSNAKSMKCFIVSCTQITTFHSTKTRYSWLIWFIHENAVINAVEFHFVITYGEQHFEVLDHNINYMLININSVFSLYISIVFIFYLLAKALIPLFIV